MVVIDLVGIKIENIKNYISDGNLTASDTISSLSVGSQSKRFAI